MCLERHSCDYLAFSRGVEKPPVCMLDFCQGVQGSDVVSSTNPPPTAADDVLERIHFGVLLAWTMGLKYEVPHSNSTLGYLFSNRRLQQLGTHGLLRATADTPKAVKSGSARPRTVITQCDPREGIEFSTAPIHNLVWSSARQPACICLALVDCRKIEPST
ncbi:hypothetical protein BDV26DRAFT_274180 [Aspergillus bertholletiae]|uniref:Uncharacterized protein n=1 Tax=Aspergillus bertholletiae TaxID=1226010 RepID=A0A5N7ARF4_9EURO|nr:hypothetical protein BDV26DRAFT_274180 [Aspergillus bertholletiae]